MIIDCFTYNNESDLLEIRLNVLDDYVDRFIIVEAPTTFSGLPKPLYYERDQERFKKWEDKITYFVIDENYSDEELRQAYNSPQTQGADHWKREFLQKESIKKALTDLSPTDRVFIGDVDEIWKPTKTYTGLWKLKLKVYTYYLNNRSNENFWGTLTGEWGEIRHHCLNHIRQRQDLRTSAEYGWHFTSMAHQIRKKLTDSYTQETYANGFVMNLLEDNVQANRDFLGRDFTYTTDTSDWPQYLLKNVDKYSHLMKI